MLMTPPAGGDSFVGNSSFTVTAATGIYVNVGPADVRQALQRNWTEVTPQGVASGIMVAPATLDTLGIQTAINATSAAGGGTVILPPGTITLTSGLILAAGVYLMGSGITLTGQGSPQLTGGTILQGDTTFPLISYNATDLGSPYSTSAFLLASWISNVGVSKMGLKNGSYGIKLGALYQGSVQYSSFTDLFIQGCTQWGLYAENFAQCTFDRIGTYGNANDICFMASGTSLWNFGNSTARRLTCGTPSANGSGRGILVGARLASQMNNMVMSDFGASGTLISNSTAATMANASTTIGLADTTNFGVGMPVTVSATANGFTQNQIYFITSLSTSTGAGNATLANYMGGSGGGTAIAATGSTAVNLVTQGWPVLEVGGQDLNSYVTYSSLTGANDLEAGGTAHVVFQAISGWNYEGGINHAGSSAADFCIRNIVSPQSFRMFLENACLMDIDSTSAFIRVDGYVPTFQNNGRAGTGFRQLGSGGGPGALFLTGNSTADIVPNLNAFSALTVNKVMQWIQSSVAGGATTTSASGHYINVTGSGTVTLLATTTNMTGYVYDIYNPTASAITVASVAQNIEGLGVAPALSFSLAAHTGTRLVAMNNASTMYWARIA